MNQPNTLFILENWGLKTHKSGIFESHMWLLSEHEESMKYISLHKSKAKRSFKGGEIIEIRLATDSEIKNHQELMIKNNKGLMQVVDERKIVMFRFNPDWNCLWPNHAKTNPMAYKGTGVVDWNSKTK